MFIFQSFISTNVRQCFCPPSIDPQREREIGNERQSERGQAATRNRVEKKIYRRKNGQLERKESNQEISGRIKEKAGQK